MDVLVVVPGREGRWKDGVPYYGLGRRFGRLVRRVDGGYVDEDLLGVPIEEGGEVCVEVEAYMCVLFPLSTVVVWTSFCHLDVAQLEASGWTLRYNQH